MFPISNDKFFSDAKQGKEFRRLIFTLCYFHALLLERKRYGSLGFNVPYLFGQADLITSVRQMKLLLQRDKGLHWRTLEYMVGEINYGGRVTDDNDRRALTTLLRDLMTDAVLTERPLPPAMKLMKTLAAAGPLPAGEQFDLMPPPLDANYKQHLLTIDKFPVMAPPTLLGLHQSADFSRDIDEQRSLMELLRTATQQGSRVSAEEQATSVRSLATCTFRSVVVCLLWI